MTKIKLCGLMRPQDIETANALRPDFVGFVFAPGSKRCITAEQAGALRALLDPSIPAVGVFIDAQPAAVAELLAQGIIDIAQLHGSEDETYVSELRRLTDKPLIRAFRFDAQGDAAVSGEVLRAAEHFPSEAVLYDSGAGSGRRLNLELLANAQRPYFLAGGLTPGNVAEAVLQLHPYAVDVSSGIETEGRKDPAKMAAFVEAVRAADGKQIHGLTITIQQEGQHDES